MRTETTDLIALFTKNNGGKHNWRYKGVDTSLPAEEIKEACELLTTLDLFEKDGVKLFDSVLSAKFVTTIETMIFDLEHDPEETQIEAEKMKDATRKKVCSFEVTDESDKVKETLPTKLLRPSIPVLSQALERQYEHIETVDTSDSITINNEALPTSKDKQIIGDEAESNIEQIPDTEVQSTKEGKGLFRWIQKIKYRTRNKEAPESTPRE
ncbi:hypothetical protein ABQD97_07535 [Enterococcus avium]|uniref:DUF2922 family protein n=1 Tax=Enterococcus avium TaxID=33945 RepID=A0ABD5FC37_ENTAV|nr:hypothetical protein [Enterococcus avium]MDT2398079.1 hypothetical protein [Enterococcus avium]MDT2434183.1 hypothetical protein [Enterococcus avium]MDT2447043.1 hypothetical protein [Enterococcus avium]MDT2464983.1 hypothetical protein [Enterococcus avium]MDT2482156.1 hypothetical protein [Enterococcus avium]